MLARMTARTFRQWQQYFKAEPFGDHLNDLRHGQQMALTCNINRDVKTHPAPFAAVDFMISPPPVPKERQLTPEEAFARIDKEAFGL